MNQNGPLVSELYEKYEIEDPVEDTLLEEVFREVYDDYGSLEELVEKEEDEYVKQKMQKLSIQNVLNPGGPGKATSEELGSMLGRANYQERISADD